MEQQECVKQIASGKLLYNTGSSAQCSVMTQRDGVVGWKAQEGEHICIHITDTHWSTEETNTTLHTNYTQIIFKNEQTSGVGVEDRMGLLLFREGALQKCSTSLHLSGNMWSR